MAKQGQHDEVFIELAMLGLSPQKTQTDVGVLVTAEFDIKHKERETLEEELERQREEDPNCAECWQIENGKIIRW